MFLELIIFGRCARLRFTLILILLALILILPHLSVDKFFYLEQKEYTYVQVLRVFPYSFSILKTVYLDTQVGFASRSFQVRVFDPHLLKREERGGS